MTTPRRNLLLLACQLPLACGSTAPVAISDDLGHTTWPLAIDRRQERQAGRGRPTGRFRTDTGFHPRRQRFRMGRLQAVQRQLLDLAAGTDEQWMAKANRSPESATLAVGRTRFRQLGRLAPGTRMRLIVNRGQALKVEVGIDLR